MRTIIISLVATLSLFGFLPYDTKAEGLPVAKYLEDPEHKNEIVGFYLNAVFSGISLANERANPRIFCLNPDNSESPYEMIDKRIAKLKKEKLLYDDSTVDEIMIDILEKEHPCK